MPKVRMLQSMAGPNLSYIPGDLVQVSDEIAAAWCSPETLIAKPADDDPGEAIDHAKASSYVAGEPAPEANGQVSIPDNWAELPEAEVLALAEKIAGKAFKKRGTAMAAIAAEVKKRADAAAAAARAAVEIVADWAELPDADLLALAGQLAGEEVATREAAMDVIGAEVKAREEAAAAQQ